jgi:hypothetical protein
MSTQEMEHEEMIKILLGRNCPVSMDFLQFPSLFGWLVADGWCWFVLREEYCWLVAAGCWWLIGSERKVLLAGGS